MGTSLEEIDRTYGHVLGDADGAEHALIDPYDAEVGDVNPADDHLLLARQPHSTGLEAR